MFETHSSKPTQDQEGKKSSTTRLHKEKRAGHGEAGTEQRDRKGGT